MEIRHAHSDVRMRRRSTRDGSLNWLLLPGGPRIGSESLHELAGAMGIPATIWLVDLPGDGSNAARQDNPFAAWPQVLAEAAAAVSDAV